MAEVEHTMTSGPGILLEKARKKKRQSVEAVAAKLHLSPSVVEQLENNEFEDEIPDAFARGYLRNYAKLLGIDEEEVIASYTQLIGQSKVKNYYSPTTTVGNPSKTGIASSQIITAVVIVILLVAAIIWYFARPTGDVEATSLSQPQQPEVQPIAEQATELTQTDSATDTQIQAESQPPVEQSAQLTAAQPVQEPTIEPQIPTGFVESSEATLAFEFAEDCWVQVTDSNGEVLAVGLKTAGRQFEVSGVAPISVVLGKPNAVNIAYNNSAVDLACFPAGSTARFMLDSPQVCET